MKVLQLISGGEIGGSKNHLVTLIDTLKGSHIDNIVVCFIRGKLYEECKKNGIDIILIEQNKRFDLSIVKKIKDICIKENIDIVNCHGGRANFIGYFLKRVYNAKYVTTIHSDYKGDYKGNTYKTLIYSNINKFVLNRFDYYITVSNNFKKMLIERGFKKENIYVVYNGIDFTKFNSDFSKEDIINRYNLKHRNNYVSMVARFHPIKGHRVFIDACKYVLDKFNDVLFVIVGDGSERETMIQYAKSKGIHDNIAFVGFQRSDEFFYLSDFTVLASYSESFPLSILESAAYKKTVISTNVGGISDLIEDGVNGYLISPGDSSALAIKMLQLLENKDMCYKFGNNLNNKAKENFSLSNLAKSYAHIYDSILNGGHLND